MPDEFTLQTDDFYFNIPNETRKRGEYAVLPLKALSEAGTMPCPIPLCAGPIRPTIPPSGSITPRKAFTAGNQAIEVYVNSGGLLRDLGSTA